MSGLRAPLLTVSIDWTTVREPCSREICLVCAKDPTAHSIYFRGITSSGLPVIYTRPAEATLYFDTNGIERHFRRLVQATHPSPWAWVFDAQGLGIAHVWDPSVGIRLARLFSNEFEDSLKEIYILNSNGYVRWMWNIVSPWLSSTLRQKVKFI